MLYEGIKHARIFRVSLPSIPNHLHDDLNEKSVISLGITICDTLKQMLTNNILLYILYRVCIKTTPSNNVNNVRRKSSIYYYYYYNKN